MVGITEVIQHTPGAMFAVDKQLRIVAWNRAAEGAIGVAGPDALGAVCYETVPAVDADTGRPCYEDCPLMNNRPWHGWVHSRVLKAGWQGRDPIRLDCMLLRYVLPSSERGTLSFMVPLGTAEAEQYLRLLSTLEQLYPVVSRSADLERSLQEVPRAVLLATGADSCELILLGSEADGAGLTLRQSGDQRAARSQLSNADRTALLELLVEAAGALVVLQPAGERTSGSFGDGWCLVAPVVADDRLLAALTVGSQDAAFNLGLAARMLFAVAAQLSVYLRWSLPRVSSQLVAIPPAAPERPILRAYCFGRFRVALDDVEVPSTHFKRQKSRTLLKLLVTQRGRALRREALAELLWPEAEPVQSSNYLRVVLHDLRRALEPDLRRGQPSSYISNHGDLLFADPGCHWWIDSEEFERLIGEVDAALEQGRVDDALAAGRAATTLYTGDFLEDQPYDDWCLVERERLRERYLDLLPRLAGLLAGRGRFAEAVDACRLALAADPLRERTHRQLMRLLWKSGAPHDALRQYEVCRRVLRDELDVAPDEATQALRRAIIDNGQFASSPRRRPL